MTANPTLDYSAIGGRHLTMLGRLFLSRHPEEAQSYLSPIEQGREADLSKIETYYGCFHKDVSGRRLFTACILHLYSPHTYTDKTSIKRGLVKAISQTTGHHHGNVSRMIQEVVQAYKVYDDFKAEVDEKLEKIGGTHG